MKSTDRMLISKLKEISEKLEDARDLEAVEQEIHSVLDSIVCDYKEHSGNRHYGFEKEKEMDVFASGTDIQLCKSRGDDRPDYVRLQKENSIMPRAYEMEGFEDMLWEDMTEEKAFYTTIRRKSDDAYMGYCGIKDTQKDELELAVELLREFHGHGYGKHALMLFMNTVKNMTGINHFKTLVDGENIASQKMCEACGGVPSGIAEHLLHDKDYMKEYEQENADEVTDVMREVATKFSVQPEKLLTHVLVYKFEV
ncbi:MAG: GNAT family N-acetyltransferase [Lachnospiraceae bacterium]